MTSAPNLPGSNRFFVPETLTKELKIQQVPSGERRIRISSNFLDGFGFIPGQRINLVPRNKGFDLLTSDDVGAPWKVHRRNYGHRKNNPTESVIDIQANGLINRLVPLSVERLHYTLKNGTIHARHVYAPLFHIRRQIREMEKQEFQAFLAMSSGLDALAFRQAGFNIHAVLEYRPGEARDGEQDFTESGVCTFLSNHQPAHVFSEDISRCQFDRVRETIGNQPIAMLSIGLQCDDFSTAKSANLKREEIAEFRPSSRELGYYATKLIEELKPATVLIENVPGWHQSEAQAILGAVLSRLGYYVQSQVLDAQDYGALTQRKRCYFVASCWPHYQYPQKGQRNERTFLQIFGEEILNFRDVSHTSTIAKATGSNRSRFCPLASTISPTVLKSQARQAKDSLYFTDARGRVLLPSLKALRMLHDIPEDFDLNQVSSEFATEQIGQGVDINLHRLVAKNLLGHIRLNCPKLNPGQLCLAV